MSVFNCPACASENTQRFSAIVEGGTAYTGGTTTGGFVGTGRSGGFAGVTAGNIKSTTRSALAIKCSPPQPRPAGGRIVFGALLIFFGFMSFDFSGFFAIVLMLIGGTLIFTGIANLGFNKNVLPGLQSRWANSFYCHRCQHVYMPGGFKDANAQALVEGGSLQSVLPDTKVPRLPDSVDF